MDAARYARIRELFLATQALTTQARDATLARECAHDSALRREVESLLAHHRSESLLDAPPPRSAPRAIEQAGRRTQWDEEQRQLLQQRIRVWMILLHLLLFVVLLRTLGFFDGWLKLDSGPRAGVVGGALGLSALSIWVLTLRTPSIRTLRGCELALTMCATVVIGSWSYGWLSKGVTLKSLPAPELQEQLRHVYWVVSSDRTTHFRIGTGFLSFALSNYWSVLGGLYGIVIPNTWQRGVAVALGLVGGATATIAMAATVNADLRPHLVGNLVAGSCVIGFGAAIGLYVGLKFQALRRAVFDAKQVGPYQLTRLLGKGAMGEVYLAQHRLLHRPCAVKLIRPEQAGSEDWLLRFELEVQTMAQLTHQNTVEVYDFGRTADGSLYCAMEYLPGMTLDALVRSHGALPPARVIHLLRQVCGALAEAHQQGVVHRDVKPGNIFVCERGGVRDFIKLLDFGLVHVLTPDRGRAADSLPAPPRAPTAPAKPSEVSLTHVGQLLGTPAYMAPEQIEGVPPDARSDIYSLGGVACFLLTSRPPFERETVEELCLAHLSEPLPNLRARTADIPTDVEQIVLRCLAKPRASRFQSVHELAEALAATACADDWNSTRAAAWWQGHTTSELPADSPPTTDI